MNYRVLLCSCHCPCFPPKTLLTSFLCAAAKSFQSCPTLCDPIDGSPPGSPVPGILHARTLEWVDISFSNAWKWKVKVKSLSRVQLFATPRTAANQAPPPMGFSRQEYWSGAPLPSPMLWLEYMIIIWISPSDQILLSRDIVKARENLRRLLAYHKTKVITPRKISAL